MSPFLSRIGFSMFCTQVQVGQRIVGFQKRRINRRERHLHQGPGRNPLRSLRQTSTHSVFGRDQPLPRQPPNSQERAGTRVGCPRRARTQTRHRRLSIILPSAKSRTKSGTRAYRQVWSILWCRCCWSWKSRSKHFILPLH